MEKTATLFHNPSKTDKDILSKALDALKSYGYAVSLVNTSNMSHNDRTMMYSARLPVPFVILSNGSYRKSVALSSIFNELYANSLQESNTQGTSIQDSAIQQQPPLKQDPDIVLVKDSPPSPRKEGPVFDNYQSQHQRNVPSSLYQQETIVNPVRYPDIEHLPSSSSSHLLQSDDDNSSHFHKPSKRYQGYHFGQYGNSGVDREEEEEEQIGLNPAYQQQPYQFQSQPQYQHRHQQDDEQPFSSAPFDLSALELDDSYHQNDAGNSMERSNLVDSSSATTSTSSRNSDNVSPRSKSQKLLPQQQQTNVIKTDNMTPQQISRRDQIVSLFQEIKHYRDSKNIKTNLNVIGIVAETTRTLLNYVPYFATQLPTTPSTPSEDTDTTLTLRVNRIKTGGIPQSRLLRFSEETVTRIIEEPWTEREVTPYSTISMVRLQNTLLTITNDVDGKQEEIVYDFGDAYLAKCIVRILPLLKRAKIPTTIVGD